LLRLQRLLVPIIAATLALAGCGGTPCEQFYDVYESCGFGPPPAGKVDKCNAAAEKDVNCRNSYNRLNYCIDQLEDSCSYPDDCASDVSLAGVSCF
jgi:hypothetical protein